ncbi:nitroreductase family deazaflavin-dependent oxidoreductase [Agromyces sp. MMS24-K17]|uniref:nitroreductase family deazaflavin-dependent oxidoreductase n=1 Tax=Agromyces sp. MMS24-K17 TaxID=3372850 RepID=UPI0037545848
MALDTPNGTRGPRPPGSSRFARWANLKNAEHIRRKGSRNGHVLVIVTVGRRTGEERMTPVRSFPDRGGSRLVVASNGGSARNPGWYFNLQAHPERARIEFAGRRIDVVPTELHGEEREHAWKRITAEAPAFAKYERTTDRRIPVIRLTPREGQATG